MHAPLRILALALVFPILLGQTGLSLHTLYCFCKGQASTSLFFLQEASPGLHTLAQAETDCCKKNSSCHPGEGERRCEKEGVPCNTHEVNYLKLHQLSVESSIEYPDFQVVPAALVPGFLSWTTKLGSQPQLQWLNSHPAHAPPGRFLRILFQSFLC